MTGAIPVGNASGQHPPQHRSRVQTLLCALTALHVTLGIGATNGAIAALLTTDRHAHTHAVSTLTIGVIPKGSASDPQTRALMAASARVALGAPNGTSVVRSVWLHAQPPAVATQMIGAILMGIACAPLSNSWATPPLLFAARRRRACPQIPHLSPDTQRRPAIRRRVLLPTRSTNLRLLFSDRIMPNSCH